MLYSHVLAYLHLGAVTGYHMNLRSKTGRAGPWYWKDSVPLAYDAWDEGQPNNVGNMLVGNLRVPSLRFGDNYKGGSLYRYVICEK